MMQRSCTERSRIWYRITVPGDTWGGRLKDNLLYRVPCAQRVWKRRNVVDPRVEFSHWLVVGLDKVGQGLSELRQTETGLVKAEASEYDTNIRVSKLGLIRCDSLGFERHGDRVSTRINSILDVPALTQTQEEYFVYQEPAEEK